VCSVFYPMHFIAEMADHQGVRGFRKGCLSFAMERGATAQGEFWRRGRFGPQENEEEARLMPRAMPIGYPAPREIEPMDATGAD